MIVAVAVLLGVQVSGLACSCVPPPPPAEALEASSAVFAGIVLDVEDHSIIEPTAVTFGDRVVTFRVLRYWKGVDSRIVQVTTSGSGASCGYPFQEGRNYLVYAHGESDLVVSLCSRTRRLKDAREDLDALGPGTSTLSPVAARIMRWIVHLLCVIGLDVCDFISWF